MADANSQRRCWAHSLGDCDSMSGEHVISNAIFKSGCGCPLVIEGVKRIRGGEPTRGAEVSNILCRKHNSMLSPLDETAGRLAKHLHDGDDENYTTNINLRGELVERWGLKTLINMGAAGWMGQKLEPAPEIVSSIFGRSEIPDGCGLYSVDGVWRNEDGILRPSVNFSSVVIPTPRGRILAGGYIAIHGMPIFVALFTEAVSWIEQRGMPTIEARLGETQLKHLYRPGAFVQGRQRGPQIHVGLSWKGLLRYADGTTGPHVD